MHNIILFVWDYIGDIIWYNYYMILLNEDVEGIIQISFQLSKIYSNLQAKFDLAGF